MEFCPKCGAVLIKKVKNDGCPRCNYSTEHKTKYVNHLKKKKICEPILSKTNLQNEYIKYDIKDKIMIPQNSTISSTQNVELHKIPQNTTKL